MSPRPSTVLHVAAVVSGRPWGLNRAATGGRQTMRPRMTRLRIPYLRSGSLKRQVKIIIIKFYKVEKKLGDRSQMTSSQNWPFWPPPPSIINRHQSPTPSPPYDVIFSLESQKISLASLAKIASIFVRTVMTSFHPDPPLPLRHFSS